MKRCLASVMREMQIKPTISISLYTYRMTLIKKNMDKNVGDDVVKRKISYKLLVGM